METAMLEKIADQFPWASWAIWDESFPDGDCVERRPDDLVAFMDQRRAQLTPSVVLMGLNRSDDLAAPFSNFHEPTRRHYDYRLKEFIQDRHLEQLHGGYMTDLVDTVQVDSGQVRVTESDVSELGDQLHLLDEQTYHLLCFGNKPFDGLVEYFDVPVTTAAPELKCAEATLDGRTLRLYRLWFYGLYGANQHKVAVLRDQLAELNDRIS